MDPDRDGLVYSVRKSIRNTQSEDMFSYISNLGIHSFFAILCTFILHIFMARLLGPEEYAIFGTYMSILFFFLIACTSIYFIIARFTVFYRSRSQVEQIAYVISRAFQYLFLFGIALFFITLLFSRQISSFFNIPSATPTIVLGFIIWFTVLRPIYEGAFRSLDEQKKWGWFRFSESFLKLVFALLFVYTGFSVVGALFGVGIGLFIALAFAYKHIFYFQNAPVIPPNNSQLLRYSFPVVLTMVSFALLLNVDLIIIKHLFSAEQAGVYAAATLLAKTPFFLTWVLIGISFSNLSLLQVEGKDPLLIIKKIVSLVVPLFFLLTLILLISTDFFLNVFFGSLYSIGPILGFYSFSMGLLSLSLIISVYLLIVQKEYSLFALPLFSFALIFLLVSFNASFFQVMLSVMIINALLTAYLLYHVRNFLSFDYFL